MVNSKLFNNGPFGIRNVSIVLFVKNMNTNISQEDQCVRIEIATQIIYASFHH